MPVIYTPVAGNSSAPYLPVGAGVGWYFCGDDVGGANFTFDAHNKNSDILSEDLNVFK